MLQNDIRANSHHFTGTYGRKCMGMWTGAWGRRCHWHVDEHGGLVRRHLGCAVGTGCTDVTQGPLALDARTSHMGHWHWAYGMWPSEDVPALGLSNEDASLLIG